MTPGTTGDTVEVMAMTPHLADGESEALGRRAELPPRAESLRERGWRGSPIVPGRR